MNFAEKFGRWFVFALWIFAGGVCAADVWFNLSIERAFQISLFDSQDATFAACGIAFFAAAVLLARRHRWARGLSFALWGLSTYWVISSLGNFTPHNWIPFTLLALLIGALLWLLSSGSMADSRQAVLRT
jgi:hypothetical protein